VVPEDATILEAAEAAGEPISAECAGSGACGRCLVRIVSGSVPEYCVERREDGAPIVLACLAPVRGPLTARALVETELPHLESRGEHLGASPVATLAPWPLRLDPIVASVTDGDLGVAVDIGTTTLQLLLVNLASGMVIGEASLYNPQIPRGVDVISRIVAAEKGSLPDLEASVRSAVREMISGASSPGGADPDRIRAYVVAGNLTMIHMLLGADPSGLRRVPSQPVALAFDPVAAGDLTWPGRNARVHTIPAVGGWVGGDIVAGLVRAGFSRREGGLGLYVDLGTNGEIALGGRDFALACACSAGPAFEGVGIRCGMRADAGAIDGARVDAHRERLELSTIGGAAVRGLCGSGLIAVSQALLHAGWIDRAGRVTERLPHTYRVDGAWGRGIALSPDGRVALYERDLAGLIRAKGAIFAGVRSLYGALGEGAGPVERVVVSGNFGRFLNLPAAVGIGLLPDMAPGRFGYVHNGALEGACLALLSREFSEEIASYLARITYVDLSELPTYMDEFVAACFLPHTSPERLRL
jgi:uncharacterized 2Fe-2S/4Fe-4S cluster protein (DUF4445 family)